MIKLSSSSAVTRLSQAVLICFSTISLSSCSYIQNFFEDYAPSNTTQQSTQAVTANTVAPTPIDGQIIAFLTHAEIGSTTRVLDKQNNKWITATLATQYTSATGKSCYQLIIRPVESSGSKLPRYACRSGVAWHPINLH